MLWDCFSESVGTRVRGDKLAVVSDDASLTYGELRLRTEALAERMHRVGVGPGHVVLGYLENGPNFLVALLASSKLGAAFAPLDVGLTDAELAATLELTQSDLVVCDASGAGRCERLTANLISMTGNGTVQDVRVSSLKPPSVGRDVGCVMFSSGTTGASKGIVLGHEALFHRSHDVMRALGLTNDDRTLCTLPLSHTHGAECLALPTLLAGGTLFLKIPKFAFPLYILEEIARHQITFFSSIPQFYDFAVRLEAASSPDIRSLRLPFCGSAALAKTTAEAFFAKHGVHIRQGYGLVELAVICMNHHDEKVAYDSVGKPIDGIEWKLVDVGGETSDRGELLVRSRAMFAGYLNAEEITREKLKDGWLHTGDIVTVDRDGLFRIVGRKEDFIKVNGFKVYAAEVETAIIALKWVKECAILSEKDQLGTEKIVAHIVPTDWTRSAETMELELIRHLRSVVSDYKVPKRCVAWREFPKNALGKILKSKIGEASSTRDSERPWERQGRA